jgi:ferredoxin-NADP reductase
MGRGLDIDKIQPGRIVLFAGGTGIFPFMDLIDILFKTIAI